MGAPDYGCRTPQSTIFQSIGSCHKEGRITFKCGVYDSLTMSISLIGTSESTCMEIFISLGEPVNEATK